MSLFKDYTIKLVARNEGVEYRDRIDVYRFNVEMRDDRWIVRLPGSKGSRYVRHDLTSNEQRTILPRIEKFLRHVKWFGFIKQSRSVVFEAEDSVKM